MSERATAKVPGRVNLIGEHTDYNGGHVMPAALSVGLEVTLTLQTEPVATIESDQHDDTARRAMEENVSEHWSDTALGALREARALNLFAAGATLSIRSTIPAGAGLSSSAALAVAILKAARQLADSDLSDIDIALAAQRVENDYLGVPCGIMDQMAVAHLAAGEAMALDTATLEFTKIALPRGFDFVVAHSGITRKLSDGRYAARKQECDAAGAALGTDRLCLLDPETIEAASIDETLRRRARHCATEHRRVLAAAEALAQLDISRFGELMSKSHTSMRDDFAMSLPPIDALVADATGLGALGARLTGGGFGGCIVACIERSRRADWQRDLLARHPPAWFVDAIAP